MKLAAILCLALLPALARAQYDVRRDDPCCDHRTSGVVWAGTDSLMTFADLAAYCGPVLWFSPDEPLLPRPRSAQDIMIPMPFPFDLMAGGPVVHYRVRTLVSRDMQRACLWSQDNLDGSVIDLSRVTAIDLDYFFYYPSEEGMGGHHHDVESVEMKLAVFRQPDCAGVPVRDQHRPRDRQGPRRPLVRQHVEGRRRDPSPAAHPRRGGQARELHRQERRRLLHAGLRRQRARERRLGRARHHQHRLPVRRRLPVLVRQGAQPARPRPAAPAGRQLREGGPRKPRRPAGIRTTAVPGRRASRRLRSEPAALRRQGAPGVARARGRHRRP